MNHSFNPYNKKLSENYILSFSQEIFNPFNDFKKANISLSYSFAENDTIISNYLNGSFNIDVGENLNAIFSTLYDFKNKKFVSLRSVV